MVKVRAEAAAREGHAQWGWDCIRGHWCCSLQEYLFALQLLDGALVTLPRHEAFSAASQVSVSAPWLPLTPGASQTYSFALFVRDAFGLSAGPFVAASSLTVWATGCPQQCSADGALLEYVHCRTCGRLAEWAVVQQVLLWAEVLCLLC